LAESALISGITVHYIRGVNASKGKASPSSSLVVLPLENLSGDKEQDYFADGMTDDLIANLAKIRSLRVISRSTAMAYKLFAQLDAHLKSNMSRRSTSQL
jgi:TolB-like protein